MFSMFRWKCTVCGEIIEGPEPPAKCPVCGVDASLFVKLEAEAEGKKSDSQEKFVIIGASGAGMAAVEEILKRNKKSEITMISKESVRGYYRPQLSKMLSHDIDFNSIAMKDENWFKENNVDLMLDKEVIKIDTENNKVILNSNEEIPYTKLIIATGAEVFVPPLTGSDKMGVFTLRYLSDTQKIKEYAKGKQNAVVIGGGVLGLETAWELKNLGLKVTVLERGDRILPRQLDHSASSILENIIDGVGVKFRKFAATKEITGDKASNGVLLEDGETIPADIVIISTGIKANSEIAANAGIDVKRAIAVNSKMETSVKDIYACGDCAEFNGVNYALWSEAIVQGKAAGINAAGDEYVYENIVPSTTLNAFNSSIFSIGDIGSDKTQMYQEYEIKDNSGKNYKKLYFKNDVLSGGILIGDISKTVALIEGFEQSKKMEHMKEAIK